MRNGVKNPRGQKHVAAAIDYVRHVGGDDPQVTKKGKYRLRWRQGGRQLSIALAAAPSDLQGSINDALQQIRRACRSIGVQVHA